MMFLGVHLEQRYSCDFSATILYDLVTVCGDAQDLIAQNFGLSCRMLSVLEVLC